jgi:hypothetical protein
MNGLIILELNCNYFTNLAEVFDIIGDRALEYNWLLSNYDCNIYPSEKIPTNERFVWLCGDELVNILKKDEIQFIWGVATAYEKGIALIDVLQYPLPFADGNANLWNPSITMQNPLADIEIIPWDSTFLIVIAKSKELIEKFAKEYPDSNDLAEYNLFR